MVDRVFAHAVNTVKRIPRTAGASRPPLADRLLVLVPKARIMLMTVIWIIQTSYRGRCTGYSGATNCIRGRSDSAEMVVPSPIADRHGMCVDDDRDAWYSHRGLSKTEAKRRYISSLIDNMTRYATSTPEARELISELAFVWDQIKNISPQQSSSEEESPSRSRVRRKPSRGDGLLELEPRSEESKDWEGEVFTDGEGDTDITRSDRRFRRRINRAIEALRADVAGLKDEMEISRRRNGRPVRREGFFVTLSNWVFRFVGVFPRRNLQVDDSFFFDMHCLMYLWRF
jgi:hypothetical protein